jgi:hypothetical protein
MQCSCPITLSIIGAEGTHHSFLTVRHVIVSGNLSVPKSVSASLEKGRSCKVLHLGCMEGVVQFWCLFMQKIRSKGQYTWVYIIVMMKNLYVLLSVFFWNITAVHVKYLHIMMWNDVCCDCDVLRNDWLSPEIEPHSQWFCPAGNIHVIWQLCDTGVCKHDVQEYLDLRKIKWKIEDVA